MREKFKNTKFYRGWVKLVNDMKPMTAKQRLGHLWMYYKEHAFCALLVLLFLSLPITAMIYQSKDVLISGMIVNITIDQEGYDYLLEDYHDVLAPGDKSKVVELDYTAFGDMLDAETGEQSYYASMVVSARVEGHMLEYMILDKYALEFYIPQEIYLDLREFFTEDEIASLTAENRLVYVQPEAEEGEEETEPFPIAVDITNIPFAKDNVNSEGKVYFALSGNYRSLEMCRDVWNRINDWKSEEQQ